MLQAAGNVVCRGNEGGEMGDSLPAVDLGQLAAGKSHTCALLAGGQLYAPLPPHSPSPPWVPSAWFASRAQQCVGGPE